MSTSPVLPLRPLAACLALALGALPPLAAGSDDMRARQSLAHAATPLPLGKTAPAPNAIHAVQNCNDSGPDSFRAVMWAAQSGDIVDLRGLTCSKITLTTGAVLTGAQTLSIYGRYPDLVEIDGNSNDALIRHAGSGMLHIDHLRLSNGKYTASIDASGGCIRSTGSVTLVDSMMSGCMVESTDGDARGGAIFASGDVYIGRSTISVGIAESDSGDARGGGVYAGGKLDTQDATIEGSGATGATSSGGGAFAVGNGDLRRSTISGNSADLAGGLMLNFGSTYPSSYTELYDDTISGNSGTRVGGVFARGRLYLTSSTIALNKETVQSGAGLYVAAGARLIGSIIAGNTVNGSPSDLGGGTSTNIFQYSEKNLIVHPLIAVPADTISADPKLGPLRDNGGSTRTHALGAGSPAIDHGEASTGDPWDGRGPGFARKVGSAVDIGAYESNGDIIFANGFN